MDVMLAARRHVTVVSSLGGTAIAFLLVGHLINWLFDYKYHNGTDYQERQDKTLNVGCSKRIP